MRRGRVKYQKKKNKNMASLPLAEISVNELFEKACVNGNLDVAEWLRQNMRKPLHISTINYIFYQVCESGHLDVVQWLWTHYSNVDIENGFEGACGYGHLEVIQWLYWLKPDMDITGTDTLYMLCDNDSNLPALQWLYAVRPEISEEFESAFSFACRRGRLEIARWIYDCQHEVLDDTVFLEACENRCYSIVQWIHEVQPERYQYTVNESGDILPTIEPMVDEIQHHLLPEKRVSENAPCSICYEEDANVITSCSHTYCTTCIQEWMRRQRCCAYCRKSLMFHIDLFKIVRE